MKHPKSEVPGPWTRSGFTCPMTKSSEARRSPKSVARRMATAAFYALLSAFCFSAHAQGTAFTYQGQLKDGAQTANGPYNFVFTVHDAESGGDPIGLAASLYDVPVTNGLFTVEIDPGPEVFTGPPRWLEIRTVPSSPGGNPVILSPRQRILPTPYAMTAGNLTGPLSASQLVGTIQPDSIAPGTITGAMLAAGAVTKLDAADGSPEGAVSVDDEGLVGLGTTTPRAGLHVSTTAPVTFPRVLAQVQNGDSPFTLLANATGIAASGSLLAIAAPGADAVTFVDISDPSSPAFLTALQDEFNILGLNHLAGARAVAFSGSVVAVAAFTDNAVTLIDTAGASAVELIDGTGGFNHLGGPAAVAFSGNLLAVAAAGDNAVTLVEVALPAPPLLRSTLVDGLSGFNNLAGASSVAMAGNLLAIGSQSDHAVTLVNIANPGNPFKLAELQDGVGGFNHLNGVVGVALDGNYLAIAAAGDGAVTLVDVSAPASPVLVAEWVAGSSGPMTLDTPRSVALSGPRLAVSGDNSVHLFDIAAPGGPKLIAVATDEVGESRLLKGAAGLAFAGTNLVVAAAADNAFSVLGFSEARAGLFTEGWTAIGTTTPQAPLHVVGDVVVEAADLIDLNASRVQVGDSARALNLDSVAIGRESLASGNGAKSMGIAARATGDGSIALGNSLEAGGFNAIALGTSTSASGNYSLAAGVNAGANHPGTFVWADSTGSAFTSDRANQFKIRAGGGVHLVTGGSGLNPAGLRVAPTTANAVGLYVFQTSSDAALVVENRGTGLNSDQIKAFNGPGSQVFRVDNDGDVTAKSFNPTSDRNAKENFAPVCPQEMLAKVAALPITRWNFKGDEATPHVGPMAQDFHAAFGLGSDDKHIATVDADGVALAAIQGLNQKLTEELQRRDAENAELRERLAALEQLMAKLNGGAR
jgi:hypothetical protein